MITKMSLQRLRYAALTLYKEGKLLHIRKVCHSSNIPGITSLNNYRIAHLRRNFKLDSALNNQHIEENNYSKDDKITSDIKGQHTKEERIEQTIDEMVTAKMFDECDTKIKDLVKLFVNNHVQKNQIKNFVGNHFRLCKTVTLSKWQSAINSLKFNGFDRHDYVLLLTRNEQIFEVKPEEIGTVISTLRYLTFRDKQILKVCVTSPKILTTNAKEIHQRFQNLHGIFPKSDVFTLLKDNPNLLTDKWEDIEGKIAYVRDEMGLGLQKIFKTHIFKRSLKHLKTRHMFMLRAGIFETPNKLGVTIVPNPSLRTIIDTKEKYFCKNVCGLSVAEFHAFVKSIEMLEDNSYNSDDDLDSDEEDYE